MQGCRSCGGTNLASVLSLGRTPLANSLLTQDQLKQPEPAFPLELAFCHVCSLVQLTETVPPEVMFREYLYFSSFSDTMLKHAQELVQRVSRERKLGKDSSVIEIASNDGYLLQFYQKQGIPVLGIEPAENIAKCAREKGVTTLCEFFGKALGERLASEGRQADVIHAHNVLAHVPDLNGFVAGIRRVLKDDGIAIIEAPYVRDLIDHCEFDTIYHEHLYYFSLTALVALFERHRLTIDHLERVAIHGGSLRLFACPTRPNRPSGMDVLTAMKQEKHLGLDTLCYYQDFAGKVAALKESLLTLLKDLKRQGKRIAAYGASAKGSTLLNYFGIGKETLDFVADRSTVKQGRYTPGTHLAIYPPEKLLEAQPDYVLLLTWNFADEILGQQEEYRRRGGKFIIPIPAVKVV